MVFILNNIKFNTTSKIELSLKTVLMNEYTIYIVWIHFIWWKISYMTIRGGRTPTMSVPFYAQLLCGLLFPTNYSFAEKNSDKLLLVYRNRCFQQRLITATITTTLQRELAVDIYRLNENLYQPVLVPLLATMCLLHPFYCRLSVWIYPMCFVVGKVMHGANMFVTWLLLLWRLFAQIKVDNMPLM